MVHLASISKNKHGLSRYIPVKVEDAVRSECGFGCAICGEIFVELHHFLPEYHEATEHNPQGIIALCEKHHQMAGSGEISLTELQRFRNDPVAFSKGFVRQDLFTNSEQPVVILGSNVYTAHEFAIVCDTIPLIWLNRPSPKSPIVINAIFRNDDFSPLFSIRNNVVIKEDLSISVRKIANRYVVGNMSNPLLELELEGGNMVKIKCARMNGLDSSIEINNGIMLHDRVIFINNLGSNRREHFGRLPREILGMFDNSKLASNIFDGNGDVVGFRQDDLIFDTSKRLLSKISDELVRRIFMKEDGRVVEEDAMGIVKNNAIYVAESVNDRVPRTPIPLTVAQLIRNFSADGRLRDEWCISGFFCDARMPSEMNNGLGWLLLDQ